MSTGLQAVRANREDQLLPSFIVIGAMKAGTTSLYHYLKDHEEVFMPDFKELDFFVEDANWSRGIDWYRRQFSTASGELARGEASTTYTQYPTHDGVPKRIAGLLPHVRLVYVVRDPVVRIRSHYQHLVMTGVEKSPPELALRENPVYLDSSKYAMQMERYLEHFPREQILVVTSEALRHHRRATMQQVYGFLGVDSSRVPEVLDTEFYRTAHRPTYSPAVLWARRFATRHMLRARVARDLAETLLASRTGDDAQGATPGVTTEAGRTGQVLAPALREHLAEQLRDDIARLHRYMPADFDGWGYA